MSDPHQIAKEQAMPPIHPDDAKDKVFTAILQALMKMGNTPSSPRELANVIVKYKYATLGGATPFATVSSRISQHFKRAAEHNPPRAPLLAKHVDEKHSRKIQYSLAAAPHGGEAVARSPSEEFLSEASLSSDDDKAPPHPLAQSAQNKPPQLLEPIRRFSKHTHRPRKRSRQFSYDAPLEESADEGGESDISDYHEEMLKGDEAMANIQWTHHYPSIATTDRLAANTSSIDLFRRKSSLVGFTGSHEFWVPCSFDHDDEDPIFLAHEPSAQQHGLWSSHVTPAESISVSELESYFGNGPTAATLAPRKSFSSRRDWEKPLLRRALSISAESLLDPIPSTSLPTATMTTQHLPKDPLHLPTASSPSFSLSRRTLGSLECYEWRTKDARSTSILRFIESTDGATEHIALRTRHTDIRHGDKHDPDPRLYLDSGFINATQLRKAARPVMGKGALDANAEASHGTTVTLNKGPLETRGTWVPLLRARDLADEFGIADLPGLAKFLGDDPSEEDAANVLTMDSSTDVNRRDSTDAAVASVAETILELTREDKGEESFVTFDDDEKSTDVSLKSSAHTSDSPLEAPASNGFSFDSIKSMLTRFPTLESFFKSSNATHPTRLSPPRHVDIPDDPMTVKTTTPTNPPMYITLVDNVAVCVAVLPRTDDTAGEYRVMRRLDSGYVNGTVLLTAGGIDTESERSMILSFEMDRLRVANKQSPLFGTWIPMRRAQELAVTCSMHDRLGPFLSSDLVETHFPSPLPFSPVGKQSDGHMKALALSALWKDASRSGDTPLPSPRRSPELEAPHLLLPKKTLKSGGIAIKVPLFGCFEEEEEHSPKDEAVIVTGTNQRDQQVESASVRRSNRYKRGAEDLTDDDTDTDTDVEEVRLRVKNIRAAAMEAMETGQSLDMEELLSRANSPIGSPRPEAVPKIKIERTGAKHTRKRSVDKMTTSSMGKDKLGAVNKKLGALNGVPKLKKNGKKSKSKQADPKKMQCVNGGRQSFKVPNNVPANASVIEVQPTKVVVTEEDEDEDVDIGGSEEEDDLR